MATEAQTLAAYRDLVDAVANERKTQIAHRHAEEAMAATGTAWHAAQSKAAAARNRLQELAAAEAGQPRTPESKVEAKPAETQVDDNKPKPSVTPASPPSVPTRPVKVKGQL